MRAQTMTTAKSRSAKLSLLYRCLPTSTSSMPALPFYTSAPTTFGLSKVNRKIANESNSPSGFYVFTLLFDCNLLSPISGLTSSLSSLVLMAMSIIPMFNGATFLQLETRNDLYKGVLCWKNKLQVIRKAND
ncbi:hypothetical protein LXL04_024336 [Taraxacum kok-saghyz]